jgi:hypothetical protein
MSSEERFFSGIGYLIDGVPLVRRPDAHWGKIFEDGVWHQVAVDVRQGRVAIDVDGKTIYAWEGDLGSLERYPDQPSDPLLIGGAFPGDFLVESCTLEPLGADAGQPVQR